MATSSEILVLESHDMWWTWLAHVKSIAKSLEIWDYVDPDSTGLTKPEPIEMPAEEATAGAWNIFNYRIHERKEEMAKITSFHMLILRSIGGAFRIHTETLQEPREIIQALRDALKPSMQIRRQNLERQYHHLGQSPTRSTTITSWLREWQNFYNQVKKRKDANDPVPGMSDRTLAEQFLKGLEDVDDQYRRIQLVYLLDAKDEDINFGDTLAKYDAYRGALDSASRANVGRKHAANAATLNEQEDAPKDGKTGSKTNQKDPKKRICICGLKHALKDCYYLNGDIRPSDFVLREIGIKKINEAMKDTRRRAAIEAVIGHAFDRDLKQTGQKSSNSSTPEAKSTNSTQSAQPLNVANSARLYYASDGELIHKVNATQIRPSLPSKEALEQEKFLLDSGSNIHICRDRSLFQSLEVATQESVAHGDTISRIEGFGEVIVPVCTTKGPNSLLLKDVAYVPGFHTNLISLSRLQRRGITWNMSIEWLMDQNQRKLAKVDFLGDNLWYLAQPNQAYAANFTKSSVPTTSVATDAVWHQRLGHVGYTAIKELQKNTTGTIVKATDAPECECEVCHLSKAQQQVSRVPQRRGEKPFERVHFDLIFFKESYDSEKYCAHFYCDYSQYHISLNIAKRGQKQLMESIHWMHQFVLNKGYTIKRFHLDNESGLGAKFTSWLGRYGIEVEYSPPRTKQPNGTIERAGRTLVTIARSMQLESKIPDRLWTEFIDTAVYLQNRTPKQALGWKTPFQIVENRIPAIAHLRILGCRAYVHRPDISKLDKLDARAHAGYLVGYEATNIWRVWIPTLDRVLVSRDVTFDEKLRYNGEQKDEAITDQVETARFLSIADLAYNGIQIPLIHPASIIETGQISTTDAELSRNAQTPAAADKEVSQQDGPLPTPDATPTPPPPQSLDPHSSTNSEGINTPTTGGNSPNLELSNDAIEEQFSMEMGGLEMDSVHLDRIPEAQSGQDEQAIPPHQESTRPTRTRRQNISASDRLLNAASQQSSRTRTIRPSRRIREQQDSHPEANYATYIADYACWTAYAAQYTQSARDIDNLPPPPQGWREMQQHPHRRQFEAAAEEEVAKLQSKNTWLEVDRPSDHQILPILWVFTYKKDANGTLLKHKARLCVRGDLQVYNSREEVAAATGAFRTFRILAAIAAAFDLEIWQLDAVNAFVNADIDEDIYIDAPPRVGHRGQCLKLHKALYGLRKSPLLWYREFSATLIELGLTPIVGENCLFVHPTQPIFIFFYVDDILLIGPKAAQSTMQELKQDLMQAYEMKDIGEAKWFLNVRILRNRDQKKLWLSHDAYIDKITQRFNLQLGSTKISSPSSRQFEFQKPAEIATRDLISRYQERVGSLIYPSVTTRPDIAWIASKLSTYNQNPSEKLLQEAEHVILYLAATKYLAIEYSAKPQLAGGCDSEACISDADQLRHEFLAASDASFADDRDTRYSSQGYCFRLFGGPVQWQASRQHTVTLSTTEAELLALSHASKELLCIDRLFRRIRLNLKQPLSIDCDNKQTVGVINKDLPRLSTKMRHVDIHQFWLRQEVSEKRLTIQWTPSASMIADGFTKPLPPQAHNLFCSLLGMVEIGHMV